jgi:4-amino-4-deoxy-L-arabinose transferase-like glycosyltransferase
MLNLVHARPQPSRYSWLLDFTFLAIFLGTLYFIFLGDRPLFVPDEGRYAEIAREMALSGDYITPRLNEIKYFEKPALFYWLGAGAIKLGGLNLWSLRSINALLGLAGCLVVYLTARKLYGRSTGLLAALILSTSTLYFVMAHMISLDLPVTVFITICLCAFLVGNQYPLGHTRRLYLYGAAIAAALAVLSKGLIGVIFPLMVIGAWFLIGKPWRLLKQQYIFSCGVIFLLIAAPWHLLVNHINPEFFHFYFIEQHFLRYTTTEIGHYQPVWFFIPTLMAGFFPWIVFLPQALKQAWKNQNDKFFLLWAVLIFLFFSFSKSKLIPYILPIFPPLAILTANYLVKAVQQAQVRWRSIAILIATAWVFLISLISYAPTLDTRTILPLATTLKSVLLPQDEVITFNQYYQDLPFYLQRRVSILNWKNELTFGMQHQDTKKWMINTATFWQRWHSKQRVFVVLSQDEFVNMSKKYPKEHFHILNATATNLLISNQG